MTCSSFTHKTRKPGQKKALLGCLPLLLLVTFLALSCKNEVPRRPEKMAPSLSGKTNVVVIFMDTLRADVLGCYGFPLDTSPELDALAKKGVLFKRTIAQCSWTRPSIGSMLTGLHARTLGLYDEKAEQLNQGFKTLAEILKQKGYTTIGVTANPNINSVFGFDQGFDVYIDSRRIWHWMTKDKDRKNKKPPLRTAREVFSKALEYINEDPRPPYYLQFNIMEMHIPRPEIREEFLKMFRDVPDEYRGYERYLGALRQVSHDIDEFVRQLTSLPGMQDTLFILAADHGEGLTDHPGIPLSSVHGYILYESNIHVPLIMVHPLGALRPKVVETQVRNMDIMPTIVDMLGFEVPENIEGVSLKSLITDQGPAPDLPNYYIAETEFRKSNKIAVYSPDWKYIEARDHWKGTDPEELQPRGTKERGKETNQLAQHPEIASDLDAFLEDWEKVHPKTQPTLPTRALSEEELEELRSLGYLQ